MRAADISVVICTYNRADVVTRAIRSVLDQQGADFEVVVVDDGSTDETRAVVQAERDERLTYVHRANGGLSAARNSGVAASRGRLVTFLDDDDELLPGCLSRVAATAKESDASVVTWGADVVDEGGVVERLRPHELGPAFDGYRALVRAGTFALTRDLYDEIGGFDEGLRANHQTELALRFFPVCRARRLTVASIDVPLTRIRCRAAERRERNDPERLLVATERIIGRHRSALARSPGLLADYLAIAGVAAVRSGRLPEARHLFGDAARTATAPRQVLTNRARWAATYAPLVARRVWRRGGPVMARGLNDGALVIYRGPWQGRRVRFLIDAAHALHGSIDFVWVNPTHDAAAERPWLRALPEERPYLSSVRELDGRVAAAWHTGRTLVSVCRSGRVVYAIGFTSLPYARLVRPRRLVWAVNGIPEERLLHNRSVRSRAAVALAWAVARIGRRPDAVIVVSDPMGRHVSGKLGGVRWAKAPTSVDTDVFTRPSSAPRRYLTYVGSGAPWQGIPLLAAIWRELAALDPGVRFRVVSRDERAAALLGGVPEDRGEMVPANGAHEVAAHLDEAILGFLVREPDIVNETSFPTKFGEYLAAGVPVVTTDIGWEISDLVRASDCGLLVDPSDPPRLVAREIVDYLARIREDECVAERCRATARGLSRAFWLDSLVADLVDVP